MSNIQLIPGKNRRYSIRKAGQTRALAVLKDTSFVGALCIALDTARDMDSTLYVYGQDGRITDSITPRALTGTTTGQITS